MTKTFWENKKVFITGHTGFKGSWLTFWLKLLGAKVLGYSLDFPSTPNLFTLANISKDCETTIGDICDASHLKKSLKKFNPDIVFHLAAQPLVRKSYKYPIDTFKTNLLGTINILEALRDIKNARVFINVTSDKCYENKGLVPCTEKDALGGYDPYSASKACAEIATSSYRNSFFDKQSTLAISTVRAGNVIGGGDFAEDRLLPDLIRAILSKNKLSIRNPNAVRPWQHVLDPLYGYILLAEKMWSNPSLSGPWNFGPDNSSQLSVQKIIEHVLRKFDIKDNVISIEPEESLYEASFLQLDSRKAKSLVGWNPKISPDEMIALLVDWYKVYFNQGKIRAIMKNQITKIHFT